jgi:hypothetical protein
MMTKVNAFFAILSSLAAIASSPLAKADDGGAMPVGQEKKFIQLVELPGQPSKMIFADGREATLMASNAPPLTVKIPVQVTENLCRTEAKAPNCYYEATLFQSRSALVWTKNPDSSRMGKKLTLNTTDDDDKFKDENFKQLDDSKKAFFSIQKFFTPDLPDLPQDRLVCDDYAWLPVQVGTKSILMKMWSSETNNPNGETGVAENMTVQSYTGMQWNVTTGGLTLNAVRNFSGVFSIFPPLSQASMMILANEQGRDCQISLSANPTVVSEAASHQEIPEVSSPAPTYIRLGSATSALNFYLNFYGHNENGPKRFR